MAEEASKLRGLEARVAALETKFNFLLQFIRRLTEREEEKKKATISKRQKEIYPALSLSKAAQTLPTPRRPAFHIPRPSRTEPRQFQPLPIPVPQLYTLLVKKKMITPVGQRTRIGPQPKDYNKDLTCEYHQGEVGHTVENCRVLRHRIQDLLDQGVLKFRIEGVINTIGAEKNDEVDITSTKIPWEPLFHELKKRGLLTTPRAPKESTEAGTCPYHPGAQDHNLQGCEEFKKERRMERIKEDFEEFCEKKKEELGKLTPATPLEMSKPDPVVIQYATKEKVMLQTASVSAVQSSEKVPSVVIQVPQPFPYHDNKRVPWNYGMKIISTREGKPKVEEEVVGNLTSGLGGITRSGRCYTPEELEKRRKEIGKTVEDPAKTKVAEDEAADFLRIIKSSEYSVVKQLSKMPSHISVLGTVTCIRVSQESSTEDIDPTRVRVNSMIVRAFDGTRREVLGEIDLPVEVGPQVYNINFQVLKIDSPYNLLLGRPWLHTAGAVPSSLHQKMKLIIGNQLVTILAEEPISIYNDGEIPYIDGCASEEASFHSFEFVTVIHRVAAVEPRLSRAGIMVAKEFVKAGFQPGQGLGCTNQGRTAIVTLEGNKDRQSSEERNGPRRRWSSRHIRTTFPASAMFQVDEGDVDELALLFAEDLNVNAITTEGDSTAFPIHSDQHEEIDLEGLLDEEDLKGYRMEEETSDEDLGEDADLPDLLPHLMISRGLETLEFEIFCEHEDPESHLQRYRKKMALYTEDEILMISMFHESLPECAVTWFYQLRNIACWEDLAGAFLDRYRHNLKAPPPSNIITAVAEEEYAGPMVEGLSIHTIAEEEDSTTPPTRHCQQGEEAKTWTCVPLLQRVSSSNEITRKTSNDPHVSEIDNKTNCSLDNIDNSDEEIELPNDILEALERQDEGSKPNIEELEIINLADEGEEPREVKIGTRCATEQKEALIALLREFHEIFAWSYQDMPGLDTDIVVHKIPLEARMQARETSTATNEARSHFEDQGGSGKAIEGRSKWPKKTSPRLLSSHTWGTFVYDVMPFGLKNAGATYQRAMVTLFHDMIHHEIEVYVDDMIAKSRTAQDHLTDLRKLFQRLKKYQLRLEPEQVCLRRHIRKVIGLHQKEIRSFLGRINYIARFIAQLTATCEPLFKLLRKDVKIKWTEDCQRAFDKIKEYLLNPPILVEKTCCALAWASKKLRQYMLYYTTWLVSRMDPIKYIFEKPALTGKIARWQVLLSEFDILFVARKAIKGQAIADYLADYPSEQLELMDSEFPDEDVMTVDEDNHGRWKLYFDGAANAVGSGIGAVLVSPKGQQTPIAMQKEANRLIQEMHAGLMGAHANGPFLARKIMRAGYYWLTMERDCIRHVQTCHKCQMYQNSKNAPPQYLHTMASPWPFSAWGMDVIGAITPKASNGHEFILVAIDYFTKWVEACSFKNVTQVALCQQFKIQHHNSAPYRPKMNGAVEAANKNVKKILSKMTETYKDWHEHLPYALCAYRTSVRTSVGATPYSLVYGMEAVLPVEVEIPSLRILSQTQLEEAEWAQARYEQLNFIDEKRLAALCHGQLYQRRIERAYNKKARPRTFQPGDLVLKKRNMALSDPRGKFAPSYEGPYVVKKAFSGGANHSG
uniref:RNA-directed DNA polymerase n=1 Tax=Fagus sylvatica TaxID=28930 RepID=A0A2N9GPI5_FAGSY